jgi:hypothetical protein
LGSARADSEGIRTIDLLAAFSHHSNFCVGCYCEDEARCHRSVPRELLAAADKPISQTRETKGGFNVR